MAQHNMGNIFRDAQLAHPKYPTPRWDSIHEDQCRSRLYYLYHYVDWCALNQSVKIKILILAISKCKWEQYWKYTYTVVNIFRGMYALMYIYTHGVSDLQALYPMPTLVKILKM